MEFIWRDKSSKKRNIIEISSYNCQHDQHFTIIIEHFNDKRWNKQFKFCRKKINKNPMNYSTKYHCRSKLKRCRWQVYGQTIFYSDYKMSKFTYILTIRWDHSSSPMLLSVNALWYHAGVFPHSCLILKSTIPSLPSRLTWTL